MAKLLGNGQKIDLDALSRLLPGNTGFNPNSTRGRYLTALMNSQKTLARYNINTPLRLSHFLGQGLVETGYLNYASENLNYSTDALMRVFPKYFSGPDEAATYARKPERIASRVYGGRMGNGDEATGDGWRYRGRGFFQLTGKDNYRWYGEMAGIDLVRNPDILEKDLKASIEVAAAFFDKTGLGEYADRDDAPAVSRGVNLGNPNSSRQAHGEADRILWTKRVRSFIDDPSAVMVGDDGAVGSSSSLTVGSSGERVRKLQANLNTLGYSSGVPDGIFGQQTRRSVILFQDEHGLEANGIVDAKTESEIEEELYDTRSTKGAVSNAGATASTVATTVGNKKVSSGMIGMAATAAGAREAGIIQYDENGNPIDAGEALAGEGTEAGFNLRGILDRVMEFCVDNMTYVVIGVIGFALVFLLANGKKEAESRLAIKETGPKLDLMSRALILLLMGAGAVALFTGLNRVHAVPNVAWQEPLAQLFVGYNWLVDQADEQILARLGSMVEMELPVFAIDAALLYIFTATAVAIRNSGGNLMGGRSLNASALASAFAMPSRLVSVAGTALKTHLVPTEIAKSSSFVSLFVIGVVGLAAGMRYANGFL